MTADKVNELLAKYGATQAQLSRFVGTDPTTVNRWCTKKHKISPIYQKAVKDFFLTLALDNEIEID